MRVLVELREAPWLSNDVVDHVEAVERHYRREPQFARSRQLGLFEPDPDFAPVTLRTPARVAELRDDLELNVEGRPTREFGRRMDTGRTFVRGQIPDEGADSVAIELPLIDPSIRAVYADPEISPATICQGSRHVGTTSDVASALDVALLAAKGMSGDGVCVAVFDMGLNAEWLAKRRPDNARDTLRSSRVTSQIQPFSRDVGHGSMCAFQIGIAAPRATLLDVPVLANAANLTRLLSDGAKAYAGLARMLDNGEINGGLVVSNSWQIYDPRQDFPANHPANYSDTPEHPFNLAVENLVDAGADVVFAAGNCGATCPFTACRFAEGESTMLGANSHPDVLSVGAVAVDGSEIGYSAVSGRLVSEKPDVLAYAQFRGSGIGDADEGTSTACPVAAGLVAAIRTRHTTVDVPPRNLIDLFRASAGSAIVGGRWTPGVIDAAALLNLL